MHPRMAQAAARRCGEASRVTRPHARRHVRFVVSLPIRCARVSARATASWRGRTTNVSRGGLAVELSKRLPPATAVAVEIRTGIGPMRMEAAVVWTRHVAGRNGLVRHGLCFADRSELLDFPVGVLLGQWLQRRARQEPRLRVQRRVSRVGRRSGGKA
jgi:PilZ domain